MTVTQIEWISKTKARIYLNDAFAFVLYLSEIRELNIKVGDELEEDFLETIRTDYLLKRAKLKAMQLLNIKDYTEHELRSKLLRDTYPSDLVDQAIDYVASYHYIDDERYTRNYISYHSEGCSRQVLRQKLMGKGISSELIDMVLEDVPTDESVLIRTLLEKKYDDRWLKDSALKQKATAYLLRRGFSYRDIKSVMLDIESSSN